MKSFDLGTWWQSRSSNEKALVSVTVLLVILLLFWRVLIGPALSTVLNAKAKHAALDVQIQQMKELQNQARVIQLKPKLGPEQTKLVLESLTQQHFGSDGQVRATGDQVAVVFRNATGEAIAQWLLQARLKANALPGEAHLNRNAPLSIPANSVNNAAQSATWDGAFLMNLREGS
ncbi:MAG: type II secretion system protein GspM [Pseudomonadota bacterium]